MQRPSRDIRCTHMELLSDMLKAYKDFVDTSKEAYEAMGRVSEALAKDTPDTAAAREYLAEAMSAHKRGIETYVGIADILEDEERDLFAGRGQFVKFAAVMDDEYLQDYLKDARKQVEMRHK